MFPRGAFPAYGNGDWSVFTPDQSATTTNSWKSWQKPAGCQWVYMYMQAAGGGGARPTDNSAANAGGGGGSGGSSQLFIPAIFLPDIVYVRPGNGGA